MLKSKGLLSGWQDLAIHCLRYAVREGDYSFCNDEKRFTLICDVANADKNIVKKELLKAYENRKKSKTTARIGS